MTVNLKLLFVVLKKKTSAEVFPQHQAEMKVRAADTSKCPVEKLNRIIFAATIVLQNRLQINCFLMR